MRRTLQLGAIGTAAGVFSGLFGVGGGIVIVPLLVLWMGYGEREATGTSLAAIGVPAVGGVLAGTWLQQRIPTRWITLGFAALLVGIAIELLL